jgi:hypothetical protein
VPRRAQGQEDHADHRREQSNGYVSAQQQNYGRHFQAINTRLRGLGL